MKKKILFIMGCLDNGGGERSLINLLKLFDYEKFEVDLILFKERGLFLGQIPEQVNLRSDCDILHLMYSDSLKNSIGFKKLYYTFIHLFGTVYSKICTRSGFQKGQYRWKKFYKKVIPDFNIKYDIAISYLEGETLYYLVDKVKSEQKIAWIHTDYSKIEADLEYDLSYFKEVDKIVTISNECKNVLTKLFPEVLDKIVTLPNLTNSRAITSLANTYYPKEFEFEGFKFVSVGRLVYLKGFDMAIQATAVLKSRGLKFKWFILGDGELRKNLKLMAKKYNVDEFIEFIGSKENPYVYMKNADIIIQTSRYEGKSMVLDEAKILRRPIIVTNYDTVGDQIREEEGLIVEMNYTAIADGIEKMLKNKERYINFLKENEYGNQEEISQYYDLLDSYEMRGINDE